MALQNRLFIRWIISMNVVDRAHFSLSAQAAKAVIDNPKINGYAHFPCLANVRFMSSHDVVLG